MSARSGGGLPAKGEVTNTWGLNNAERRAKGRSGLHFPALKLQLLVTGSHHCAVSANRELGPSAGQSLLTADIGGTSSLFQQIWFGALEL